jgi:hypothetical protein
MDIGPKTALIDAAALYTSALFCRMSASLTTHRPNLNYIAFFMCSMCSNSTLSASETTLLKWMPVISEECLVTQIYNQTL